MKKGVIALLLILVVVIIFSPAIVGKLAEQQVDENLNWAAAESGELKVTSEGFDRGWFSSEGQHRIELGDGALRAMLATSDSADDIPVLLISTRLDHGLIPVSSMGRDNGSLAPGLGSAVSTLSLQSGDETIDIPGVIYSTIGLTGDLASSYQVEAGSKITDDGSITWDATELNFAAGASTHDVRFDGNLGALTIDGGSQKINIDGITISGDQKQTSYGIAVGDVNLDVGAITVLSGGTAVGGLKSLKMVADSEIDDGKAGSTMTLRMESQDIIGFGAFTIDTAMRMSGADAAASGNLQRRLSAMSNNSDPTAMIADAEEEFIALLSKGLKFEVTKMDVALPMGTVEAAFDLDIRGSDGAFAWTSLFTSATAKLDLRASAALVDLLVQMNPEAGMLVGMGFFKKNGDFYEMDAAYEKASLTVNGAPIPVPLGAFQ